MVAVCEAYGCEIKKNCVRKLSGQEIVTLHVKAKDTVKSVKDKVASVLKLDPRETKLTLACGATQLRDEKDTMHACRIQNDAVLTAILQNIPKEPRRPCWMERTVTLRAFLRKIGTPAAVTLTSSEVEATSGGEDVVACHLSGHRPAIVPPPSRSMPSRSRKSC